MQRPCRVGKAKRAHGVLVDKKGRVGTALTCLCPPYETDSTHYSPFAIRPKNIYPPSLHRPHTGLNPAREGRAHEASSAWSGERRLPRGLNVRLHRRRPGENRWHYDRPPFKGFASRCPGLMAASETSAVTASSLRRDVVDPGINEKPPRRALCERPNFGLPDRRSTSARHPSSSDEGEK